MRTCTFLFALLLISYIVNAQIIHVPADQPTIQAGIDAAADGDTVLVAENTYYENISFNGRAILLASEFILDGDTNHIVNTIINGSQSTDPDLGSVVTFGTGEDTTSVLCGFTITGGTGTFVPDAGDARGGGGVFIQYSGGKLLNNYIEYNLAENQGLALGGGVCAGGPVTFLPWVVLRGNRISHNVARSTGDFGSGGGVIVFYNLIMENNQVLYNEATGFLGGDGAGVECMGSFGPIDLDVRNNTIMNNLAWTENGSSNYDGLGGGMCLVFDCKGIIANNEISFNRVEGTISHWSYAPGVFIQEIIGTDFVFEGNLIHDNIADAEFCRGGGLCIFKSGGIYQNNVIENNNGSYGGGISIAYNNNANDTAALINNTVTGNEAVYGGGIHVQSINNAVIVNSIIWNNIVMDSEPSIFLDGSILEARYSDIQGDDIWPGEGNMNLDPQFLGDGYHIDPQSLLKDAAISSISINGIPYSCPGTDIDSNTRAGLNAPPDIGADEIDLYASTDKLFSGDGLQMKLYPNPTKGLFTISLPGISPQTTLTILNLSGKEIMRLSIEELNTDLDISHLPAGMYFFELTSEKGVQTGKIIKE